MASIPGEAGPGAPFPQWTVTMTSATGYPVAEVTNATEKALAEAAAFPTQLVFFTSESAADSYSKSLGGSGTTTPGAKLGAQSALNTGTQAVQDIATGDITGGLHWPGADNFLVRTLKIVVGGVLLIAGILKMTGASRDIGGIITQTAAKLPGV
jgi:hypothetical protein